MQELMKYKHSFHMLSALPKLVTRVEERRSWILLQNLQHKR